MLVYVYAIPVFVFLGCRRPTSSPTSLGQGEPGRARHDRRRAARPASWRRRSRCVVGFYAAVATYRFGLDPDNHGIPIVTSSLDLLGALSLILAIVILGLDLTACDGRQT